MASESTNPMAAFFALYPSFNYNPRTHPAAEFRRLCRYMDWEMDDNEQKSAWFEFQNAVARLFNGVYGTDATSLQAWQHLCRRVRIDPPPDVLEEAREAVFNTHVNLMDLAEVELHPGREVRLWPTEARLAKYTRDTGRIVSSSSPMAGGLLKALLRYIFPSSKKRLTTGPVWEKGASPDRATDGGSREEESAIQANAGASDGIAGGQTKKKKKTKGKGKKRKAAA
ncbi:hypothetical protein FA13DRAFT_1744575 [Coprinellus micaceus]|uniref:Uncharacterized protein n=1 Tax=Coprinellus micaceus TaxID=71717 RepID=A0A4Y7SC49_COPMI|nr:hypothetical protein FA13DRAFT_1744575 [Coprinellus micaceus]